MTSTTTGAAGYDLGSGHMGNGLLVWNRAREIGGDYAHVALIDSSRTIRWRDHKVPDDVVTEVEKVAFTDGGRYFTSGPLGQDVYAQHAAGDHSRCRRPECTAPDSFAVVHAEAREKLEALIVKTLPEATVTLSGNDSSSVYVTALVPARAELPDGARVAVFLCSRRTSRVGRHEVVYSVRVGCLGQMHIRNAFTLEEALWLADLMLVGHRSRGII